MRKELFLAMTDDMDVPENVHECVFSDSLIDYLLESGDDIGTIGEMVSHISTVAAFRIALMAMRAGCGHVAADSFVLDKGTALNVFVDNCIDVPLICGVTYAAKKMGLPLTYWYYSAKYGKYLPMMA